MAIREKFKQLNRWQQIGVVAIIYCAFMIPLVIFFETAWIVLNYVFALFFLIKAWNRDDVVLFKLALIVWVANTMIHMLSR